MEQILALSPNFDATQLKLTAAEGYLLSRIDGATPWRLLREMGGAPADEVDDCLTRWIEEGVLEVVGGTAESGDESKPAEAEVDSAAGSSEHASETMDAASVPSEPPLKFEIDEGLLDDSLELDLSVQRRILEFEASLGLPYQDLLGVPIGSEPKVVKRAYFKLSKEFHPDRYFRREIGGYTARLERIFKKVLEAHEMLSDPELCQVENRVEPDASLDTPIPEAAAEPVAEASAAPESVIEEEKPAPRELTKLERLRQRMPFKIDPAAIAARRSKADGIFRAACISQKAGKFQEAESGIRIAISFDPVRTEFKEALGALRLEAAGERASKLLAAPSDKMSDSDLREALTLLEDVLIYRPHDPLLNERAARVCLQLRKFPLAEEFATTFVERCPESAESHALLGMIYRGNDKVDEAVREFETALKHDQDNIDARRALAAIRIGHHDAVQGGVS
jgi:tetratricopeptide (TPR) repeat protein